MRVCDLFENAYNLPDTQSDSWFSWISKVEELLKKEDGINSIDIANILYYMEPTPKDHLYDNLYNNFYLKDKSVEETVEYLLTALHHRMKYKNHTNENYDNIIHKNVSSSLDRQKTIPNVFDKKEYKNKKPLKRKKSVYGLDQSIGGMDSASGATDGAV